MIVIKKHNVFSYTMLIASLVVMIICVIKEANIKQDAQKQEPKQASISNFIDEKNSSKKDLEEKSEEHLNSTLEEAEKDNNEAIPEKQNSEINNNFSQSRPVNNTSRGSNTNREPIPTTSNEIYLGWFSSTGYCTEDWRGTGKPHACNSGDPTIGAMGEKVIPYKTIAVDPNVIALGSQLKIVDEYGNTYYVRANDVGGAIKGNKIDMVCSSHADAYNWGRRKVQIWKLN